MLHKLQKIRIFGNFPSFRDLCVGKSIYFLLASTTLHTISVHYEIIIAVLIEIIFIFSGFNQSISLPSRLKLQNIQNIVLLEFYISYDKGLEHNKNQLII